MDTYRDFVAFNLLSAFPSEIHADVCDDVYVEIREYVGGYVSFLRGAETISAQS